MVTIFCVFLFALNSNFETIDKESQQVGFFKSIYFVDYLGIDAITEQLNYDQTLIHTESLYGMYQDKQLIGINKNYHLFHTLNVLYGEVNLESSKVVLNKSAAYNYFGSLDVVGKTITLNDFDYIVGGVVADEISIKKFLNETTEILYVSAEEKLDFEYGKVEVYKSNDEIGIPYYDYLIQTSDKIDFLSLGKSQSQYIYFMLLPLILVSFIILIKYTLCQLKIVRDRYSIERDKSYGFKIFTRTVKQEKMHIFWAVIASMGIVMIMVYLVRDIYFVETYLPNRLYKLGDYIESLKLLVHSLIKPDFSKYIFETDLLILHCNRWLMLIGFSYSCIISVMFYSYNKNYINENHVK